MTAITAAELAPQMPDATQLLSDEPEMESSLHYFQLMLLVSCLEFAWRNREDFFIGANLTIYFSRQQLRNRDFRGPDFFLVKNTSKKHRNSWVVWEEDGRYPDLIIELLSDSTADIDRHLKKKLYGQMLRIPEYFYFSPQTLELAGFRLQGDDYQPLYPNAEGRLWSEALGMELGIDDRRLRYFTADGMIVPTPQEAFQAQESTTAVVKEELQQTQRQLEQLRDKLRSLGISPEECG
jgi:Uma2 family endonuclease